MDATGVKNLSRAGKVYIAGAPTADGLKALKAKGVTTLIDLRQEKQTSHEDATAAKAAGVERIHLPMESTGVTDAQAKAFLEVMHKHKGETVLIHCGSANRAGAMYGLHLGATGACSVEDAIRHAKATGMRNEGLANDVRTYLETSK